MPRQVFDKWERGKGEGGHTGKGVVVEQVTNHALDVEADQAGVVGRSEAKSGIGGGVLVRERGSVGLVKHEGIVAESELVCEGIHALDVHEGLEVNWGGGCLLWNQRLTQFGKVKIIK
jgi:hypothetical protein